MLDPKDGDVLAHTAKVNKEERLNCPDYPSMNEQRSRNLVVIHGKMF